MEVLYPLPQSGAAPIEKEQEILAFWKREDIFRRTMEARQGANPFVFFEGPPTANGRPGVHHVLARATKDIVCRYQTMRGRYVLRRGGWDTHGLPVELEVEKRLGFKDKREVVQFGIERFNEECRKSVFKYLDQWCDLTERIGFWVNLDDAYVTLRNEYIESVWHLLRVIHDRGLIHRGFKVVPYSTKSGTTLSDHEVALGYRDVDDPSVTIRFRSVEDPDVSFLVWTTTPWTLPGNTALAVHPDVHYVKVRAGEETFILAKDLAPSVLKGDYEILETVRGADLLGRRYVPLFDFHVKQCEAFPAAFTVIPGDFVTITDGTGIVHQAPAFGAEDLESANLHHLPLVRHVDDEGKLIAGQGSLSGLWFKDADEPVLQDLRERGLLYDLGTYRHAYPFNWRGSDPLMYVAKEAWYIHTSLLKDRLVELNREILWVPDHIRDGRFGNWLENNVDWAISRERFWGTPLPIWVSDRDRDRFEVIGSVAELAAKSGRDLSGLDLHRPQVDDITWPDGEGGTMRRIPEVLDVWFDSGAMPFAQWHAPFENSELAESQFPADFISEGVDQTRGWFYSLHAIATLVKDSPAYKACLVTGLLMGEDGFKMSKSRKNTVDPWEAVGLGGADALRWFLCVVNNPSGAMRFSSKGVEEVARRFLGTLRNLYAFFAQYANLDGYRPSAAGVPRQERPLLDRWILSRLQATNATVRTELDRFELSRAGRAIEQFVVEDLSNWYVRRSRERFWAQGLAADKRAAFDTLFECLDTVCRLAAPFVPFVTEDIHRGLTAGAGGEAASVHLTSFPEVDGSASDGQLERSMEDVRRVVRLGRAGRNRVGIKTRQPLARVRIGVPAEGEGLGELTGIVLEELNVKEAIPAPAGEIGCELSAKARFDVLGPRFGQAMKTAAAAIASLSTAEVAELERKGVIRIDVSGVPNEIRREEVEVSHVDPQGWVLERESGWTVALDLSLDDELRGEGFAREVVNKIQFMRKKAGFGITDRIEVFYEATPIVREAIDRHETLIRRETLAARIEAGLAEGETRAEWKINGEPAVFSLRRV